MKVLNVFTAVALAVASSSAMAYEFAFDRPGTGFGTGITPVGKLAWEQGLPSFSYSKSYDATGAKVKTIALNTDVLLRTGLMNGLELQVGWDGHVWQKTKVNQASNEMNGLGDMSVGLKKGIDLNDDRLAWAVMASATISTGNDEFTDEEETYTLGSSLEYAYSDLVSTALTMNYSYRDSTATVQAIPTIGYNFTEKLSGYGEFVYSKTENVKSEKSLGTGVVYAINDKAQVDASVSVDLTSENQRSFSGGLGVAYLF